MYEFYVFIYLLTYCSNYSGCVQWQYLQSTHADHRSASAMHQNTHCLRSVKLDLEILIINSCLRQLHAINLYYITVKVTGPSHT